MCKRLDVTGQRYGKLLVISDAPSYVYKDGSKQRMLLCKCDCGNEAVVRLNDIRKGATKSCGCVFRTKEEALAARPAKYKELTGKEWEE